MAESYNQSFFSIGPGSADKRAGTRDEGTQKDRLAAANVGQAYASRTGKSGGREGEKKVIIPKDVKARAEELGVDLPDRSWRGNRSAVAADVKSFNAAMAAAEASAASEAEKVEDVKEVGAEVENPFEIEVGGGEVVVAADPGEYGLGGNEVEAVGGDEAAVGLNTAANFDEVVTSAGNAADNSSTNTLMTGAFDDNYMADSAAVSDVLDNEASTAADVVAAVTGTSIDAGQTSAISGEVSQALASENSTGEAEDNAIADYTAGTQGTIMTSPQGLLNDESDVFSSANDDEGFLRQQRSLGGGLLY